MCMHNDGNEEEQETAVIEPEEADSPSDLDIPIEAITAMEYGDLIENPVHGLGQVVGFGNIKTPDVYQAVAIVKHENGHVSVVQPTGDDWHDLSTDEDVDFATMDAVFERYSVKELGTRNSILDIANTNAGKLIGILRAIKFAAPPEILALGEKRTAALVSEATTWLLQ